MKSYSFSAAAAVIGGFLATWLGGLDGVLATLAVFVLLNYLTGFMCALVSGNMAYLMGFKGIFRKITIFFLVAAASLVDKYVLGDGQIVRTTVIFFFISNEGIGILDNAASLGLPIPQKLQELLAQIKDK